MRRVFLLLGLNPRHDLQYFLQPWLYWPLLAALLLSTVLCPAGGGPGGGLAPPPPPRSLPGGVAPGLGGGAPFALLAAIFSERDFDMWLATLPEGEGGIPGALPPPGGMGGGGGGVCPKVDPKDWPSLGVPPGGVMPGGVPPIPDLPILPGSSDEPPTVPIPPRPGVPVPEGIGGPRKSR